MPWNELDQEVDAYRTDFAIVIPDDTRIVSLFIPWIQSPLEEVFQCRNRSSKRFSVSERMYRFISFGREHCRAFHCHQVEDTFEGDTPTLSCRICNSVHRDGMIRLVLRIILIHSIGIAS